MRSGDTMRSVQYVKKVDGLIFHTDNVFVCDTAYVSLRIRLSASLPSIGNFYIWKDLEVCTYYAEWTSGTKLESVLIIFLVSEDKFYCIVTAGWHFVIYVAVPYLVGVGGVLSEFIGRMSQKLTIISRVMSPGIQSNF